jgi:hypothetical protein
MSKLCAICHHYHSRISCPVCGAFKITASRYVDRANGKDIVRGIPCAIVRTAQTVTRFCVPGKVSMRLVRGN